MVTNFVQSHAELQTETGHMGEIFGVMEQMKENFASELEELEASEKAAVCLGQAEQVGPGVCA